eukprot:TRINITY_DN1251_c0_g1_i5.p1 TRINITY_DN1251_c0_g1~~TRINITY_DN1251_c0_g1_i5.p1  ORF type:complete len:434 (+),score=101.50 TRINITY_DN1251_c0_g1_i5:70-1371(+)
MLLALLDASATDRAGGMRKHELIDKATVFCSSSFTQPVRCGFFLFEHQKTQASNGFRYTAWNSMKQLEDKGMVMRAGNPPVFYLSTQGQETAQVLQAKRADLLVSNDNADGHPVDYAADDDAASQPSQLQPSQPPPLPPPPLAVQSPPPPPPSGPSDVRGPLRVELLLDLREIGSAEDRNYLSRQLAARGVACESKRLSVGDMLWVGRAADGVTYVLNCIVERKKVDDLVSSIMDHRYTEQKFRLRGCGISNVVYLVEGALDRVTGSHFKGLPSTTIESALLHTQLLDNFHVVHTHSIEETVSYLCSVTKFLRSHVDAREGAIDAAYIAAGAPTLDEFNEATCKYRSSRVTVGGVFAAQLLQLPQCSGAICAAIAHEYPTPRRLMQAYAACTDDEERTTLLRRTVAAPPGAQRGVGPALSEQVCRMYTANEYG